MRRLLLLVAVLTVTSSFASQARAQVPFFNRGAALFDPEISILNTGVVNDVQATVSADRKYVTLNMRLSNSELVALRQFPFQTGGNTGFAGDPAPAAPAAPQGNAGAPPPAAPPAPAPVNAGAAQASVLAREGMTLVGRANSSSASAGAP